MQISKVQFNDQQYPDILREIASTAKQLYTLGESPKTNCVAIVGSRKPTTYGKEVTYKLTSELAAAGIKIVSGLAYGIDGVAHQAALDAGDKTVAALASLPTL